MKIGTRGYSTNQNLFWTVFGFIILGLILLMVTGTLQYRPQPLAGRSPCPSGKKLVEGSCVDIICKNHNYKITTKEYGYFDRFEKRAFKIKKMRCDTKTSERCSSKVKETNECSGEFKLNIDRDGEYSESDAKRIRKWCEKKDKESCGSWRICTWKNNSCSYESEEGKIKTVSCVGLDAHKCSALVEDRGCKLEKTKKLICSNINGSGEREQGEDKSDEDKSDEGQQWQWRLYGDRSDGDRSDGDKSDEDKSDGDRSDGDRSDGDRSDGGQQWQWRPYEDKSDEGEQDEVNSYLN